MPAVFVQGARQVGKTTLAKQLLDAGVVRDYVSLDDPLVGSAIRQDVVGFVRALRSGTVIDEVQRIRELMPVIKMRLDEQREAGTFLLTGSANPRMLPLVSDALVGRVGVVTLMPLSQGEIEGVRETWLERIFASEPALTLCPPSGDLTGRLVRGGYPEAVLRGDTWARREWLLAYIDTLMARDVRDLAEVERLTALPVLLRILAASPCQLLNIASLSRELGLAQPTLHRYLSLFEALFIVLRVPAWYARIRKRLLKSPKILLNDTGLATVLIGVSEERLQQEPVLAGRLLENFVGLELLKQIHFTGLPIQMHHFRTDKGIEVDFVLEDARGHLVGVEVKAGASVGKDDFRGLHTLQTAVGDRFLRGVVLYGGERVLPFGAKLWAMPISALWTPGP
ncbi:MAG: ATP-binding protein [Fimbriimonadales bacterium]|nr:ATP-binding protein [Fimbriimonadales bacterium]